MTFKELMGRSGFSQTHLACVLDVRPSAVCHWVNGRCNPSRKYRKKICKILGCSEPELEEAMKEEKEND